MKVDTDPDIFQLEMNQLRDKPIDQDEVVCTEHLTTIMLRKASAARVNRRL